MCTSKKSVLLLLCLYFSTRLNIKLISIIYGSDTFNSRYSSKKLKCRVGRNASFSTIVNAYRSQLCKMAVRKTKTVN